MERARARGRGSGIRCTNLSHRNVAVYPAFFLKRIKRGTHLADAYLGLPRATSGWAFG
jgi:hypothetical protein